MELIERLRRTVQEVAVEHAPDPRLSVYEVWVSDDGGLLTLEGEVSEAAALEALRGRVADLDGPMRIEDNVRRLPETRENRIHALVKVAVAPLLAGPIVTETHVSQAVLGQHLLVLRRRGRWLQVRAEDGYIGWVHRGYVHRVDEAAARAWKVGAEQEVYISLGAELTSETGDLLARLPWGSRLLADGTFGALPNGVRGRLVGEVLSAAERPIRFPADGKAVVETAQRWTGTPYLWGGITPAGADCSGFAQAVYRLHGIDLPRDSDQQAAVGEEVALDPEFSQVRPGDLLFFAEMPRRVSHVAISMGGSRLIHSALGNGGVGTNDLRGDSPMERDLRRLLVGARRVGVTG